MICPVCKESMFVLELDQVEIDYCSGCGGIWLDAGELELLVESEAERTKLINSLKEEPKHPEKKYRCPICRRKMIKVRAGENRELLIDKCINAHGFWFDKGELNSVLEMNAGPENKIILFLKEMFENKNSSNKNGGNR